MWSDWYKKCFLSEITQEVYEKEFVDILKKFFKGRFLYTKEIFELSSSVMVV